MKPDQEIIFDQEMQMCRGADAGDREKLKILEHRAEWQEEAASPVSRSYGKKNAMMYCRVHGFLYSESITLLAVKSNLRLSLFLKSVMQSV